MIVYRLFIGLLEMFNPAVDPPDVVTKAVEFLLGFLFFPSICLACQRFLRSSTLGQHYCRHYRIAEHGIQDIR